MLPSILPCRTSLEAGFGDQPMFPSNESIILPAPKEDEVCEESFCIPESTFQLIISMFVEFDLFIHLHLQ